jgi:glutaredoxin 3
MRDCIKDIIEGNDVVVFSASWCGFCKRAKKILDDLNIAYISVDASPEQLEALEEETTQSSIPSIWIKGTFIGGCNDGPESWMGLNPCISSGKLSELLSS